MIKVEHAGPARERLICQFRDKPKFRALLELLARRKNMHEQVIEQMTLLYSITDSVGAQLDGIGEIIGEPRSGRPDQIYRKRLLARVLLNLSSGTPNELIAIAEATTDATVDYAEMFPAGQRLELHGAVDATIEETAVIISIARVGGTRATLEFSEAEDIDTFSFADGDEATQDVRRGFGANAGTTGGVFADILEA